MKIFLVLFLAVSAHDTYTERIDIRPISESFNLVNLYFEIQTDSKSSRYLDLFPQSVASVLLANRDSVKSITGRIVRGRWKWDESIRASFPTGSSMFLRMQDNDRSGNRSVLWTQTAWLFSSVLAGSFESLAPEQKSFSWITPMDLDGNIRVGFNPNEPLCTDNLKRFTDLLPCRSRSGLGKRIMDFSLPMARSEYISVSLEAKNYVQSSTLGGTISVVLPKSETPNILSEEEVCPVGTVMSTPPSFEAEPVRVLRSLTGSELGPERRYGQLVISIVNRDKVDSHTVEINEQLPYFLVPLWHTQKGPAPTGIRWSEGNSPTYMRWLETVAPGETKHIVVSVYKRFIPMSDFSYSFEKGFDVGSAAYRIDDSTEWSLTRGLVVVIPLPDQTSTFNAIAVAVTPIGLLFGMIFRSFLDKRSELLDEKKSDERDPPLFRLIRWILRRFR